MEVFNLPLPSNDVIRPNTSQYLLMPLTGCCVPYSTNMKMEAVFHRIFVTFHTITRHYISEGNSVRSRHCENLQFSYTIFHKSDLANRSLII
jgi:hypothetical protein